MWFTYTAIKDKDILSFAGDWMELENIILSEVTQTQKDMHGMYSLINRYQPKTKVKTKNKKKCTDTQDTVHRTQKTQQDEVPK